MTLSPGPHNIRKNILFYLTLCPHLSLPNAVFQNRHFTLHAENQGWSVETNVEQSDWTDMLGKFHMAATLMRHLQISDGSVYVSV